jgi:serine/threonine-protein kinase HipA
VLLNNRLVGRLEKARSGAISFDYEQSWLDWENAIPVSLSMPLREGAYRGEQVTAVFENLLPDSLSLRRRVAEKVGAAGTDAYSMLAAIGRDCVGALQFLADGGEVAAIGEIQGEPVSVEEIEKILKGLAQAPLGLTKDDDFRISVAGAQEKTALLYNDGKWLKPLGTTPTTHLFKPSIGRLPNGIDLTHSVENEFYCLTLASAFGLPVNNVEMQIFGETKALVVERFDRRWARDGRLLRIPQEDCCQALSIPPTRKYQSDGGPNLVEILTFLQGSDTPLEDQANVFKAQIFFWLIGATDGHAKNFSVYLGSGGSYHLTPLYDILTAQPSLDAKQTNRNQMRLAMSVGSNRHYRLHEILGRHFVQTGAAAKLPETLVKDTMQQMLNEADTALRRVEKLLPKDFPMEIHNSVCSAVGDRIKRLSIH